MSVINKTGYIDFYSPEYLTFHATQYDDGTRSITLIPKNGSEMLIFEPNEWDASVIYCKADNNVCMDNAVINNDYSLTFELTEQMLAVRGKSAAQFCLTRKSDSKTIRSTAFYIIVNESAGIDQLESTSEFNTLNILIKKINNAYTQTESIIEKSEEVNELYNQAVSIKTQSETALETAEEAVKVAEQVNSNAEESATKALSYQSNALKYSQKAQSYSIGGTGTRTGEDIDNAKYYYEQCKAIAELLGYTV